MDSVLGKAYHDLPETRKRDYLDSIQKNIQVISNDSIKIQLLYKAAAEYYYLKENKSSFKLSNQIYKLSQKRKDSFNMGRALYYMGDCYEDFQKDSAYYYYKESEKIFKLIKNDDRTAKALFNKAHLLFTEGNYVESEVEVMKALQKLRGTDNYELIFKCYYLQSSIHIELEEFDKALEYLKLAQKALTELRKTNKNADYFHDYDVIAIVALCNVYDKKGQYNKSIGELEKIITPELKSKYPKLYSSVIGNLSYSKMKSGNFIEAKKLLDESINLTKRNKDDKGYLYKTINFGEYYLLQHDTASANTYFKEALFLARKLKSGKEVLKALHFLSVSDYPKANSYKDEYVKVSDSIVKQQRISRDTFARIEYETSKIENTNKTLNDKNLFLIIVITLSVILFLVIIIIKNKIAQKKETAFLAQKKVADEELFNLISDFQVQLVKTKEKEQNRISKELHDGIMNQIYGVRLNLGFLNNLDNPESKEKRLFYITELQRIEKEVRELSHGLHTETNFTQADFEFLLHALVQSNNEIASTNFSITVTEKVNWNAYSSVIKVNIYRILQELFLNVNKYAKASECTLTISLNNNSMIIELEDNGIGFEVVNTTEGIGLMNVKARAATIDAEFKIISKPNKGTKITLTLPSPPETE
ncbi:tetratricopeptide repeat-containing sensor histidine kinase [Flavobacterium saliperosum]|uniref:tetratricopeptide repeat-containing sensor histidine kinase n=1 Tax=Flavobacterium saliperosum TaxID=329186 RepID=UPI0006861F1F|nr:ATP-binding protein [Flavobacterium saliperosum]